MLFTYDGIVVGRRDIGESNCFIDILTDEQGIIEATAHGVKKINSSLLGSCGLFSYATFCLNKTKQRYSVNSAKPKRSFHELGSDIEKLALGSYFAQAVKFCTPQEQAAEGSDSLVRFFAISLYEAEMARDTARLACVKAAFELRFSCMLGYFPDLRGCCNCGCGEHDEMFFLPDSGELIWRRLLRQGIQRALLRAYPGASRGYAEYRLRQGLTRRSVSAFRRRLQSFYAVLPKTTSSPARNAVFLHWITIKV